MVLGHYLTVAKWCPNFHPSQDKITKTVVWMRFPEIPIEFFQEHFLLQMRSLVGRTIKVDPTTLSTIQGKFARVCVEVDFRELLVPLVSVMGDMNVRTFIPFSLAEENIDIGKPIVPKSLEKQNNLLP